VVGFLTKEGELLSGGGGYLVLLIFVLDVFNIHSKNRYCESQKMSHISNCHNHHTFGDVARENKPLS